MCLCTSTRDTGRSIIGGLRCMHESTRKWAMNFFVAGGICDGAAGRPDAKNIALERATFQDKTEAREHGERGWCGRAHTQMDNIVNVGRPDGVQSSTRK